MNNSVSFFLNGEEVTIQNPSPNLLLLDYLRSDQVGLTGAKKGCGQGGCGACTVILSTWNEKSQKAEHKSINSCLRPVCALGGMTITTVEGTGGIKKPENKHLTFTPSASRGAAPISSIVKAPPAWNEAKAALSESIEKRHKKQKSLLKSSLNSSMKVMHLTEEENHEIQEGINPVAHRLAINNGTQCGYCTVGFVMNMSAFLSENPCPTKQQIEDIFDGNICRCTGYRSILTGMKTFASDWSKEDEIHRMKCITEDKCDQVMVHNAINIPFPKAAKMALPPVSILNTEQKWLSPETLDELKSILRKNPPETTRIVFGNTSFGIYAEEFPSFKLFVDIKLIPDLYGIRKTENGLEVGASTTYSELLNFLDKEISEEHLSPTSNLGILQFMCHRTAGMIVRNAASLAGNTMLVLKHLMTGAPFPSDLFTALDGIDAEIKLLRIKSGKITQIKISDLVNQLLKSPEMAFDLVILSYYLPYGDKHAVALAQKVAIREVNSHSIVNSSTKIELCNHLEISNASIVFGGIAPVAWHATKTEQWLKGKMISLELLPKLTEILRKEVKKELNFWEKQGRMIGLPSEGFTDDYKVNLAISFIYKAIIRTLVEKEKKSVPKEIQSAGQINWGNWGLSNGIQKYVNQSFKDPVSQPYIKLMAFHQAMGQVHYTHEIELPPIGKNAAFIQSSKSLASYYFIHPESKKRIQIEELEEILTSKFKAFFKLITYKDIPKGGLNFQGMGADQPIFAVDNILYPGQVIAMVIANTEQDAIEIGEYGSKYCVGYDKVQWDPKQKPSKDQKWEEPIISIDDAIKMGSIFPDCPKTAPFVSHIWKITRPGTELYWANLKKDPLDKKPKYREEIIDGAKCNVIENTQICGEQVHFYMETQSCVAFPEDDDMILVHPSSQSPMEMHQTVASSLAFEQNKVNVSIRQLGGGYGGKTEQTKFVVGPVVVAANSLKRPIRLAMKREHDTAMIGKRHGYYGQYQIAVDQGKLRPEDRGIIRGLYFKIWADGGAFYDCSYIVSNCVQLRIDNAYKVKNFESQLDVCRTNKAPNTAMRAFGDIQGKLISENAIDDAAFSIGMDPVELRRKNMYVRGDVTPFGQALSYCYMRDVWNYVEEKSNYKAKLKEVNAFNKANKWKKRGIYMVPVKYGSGYNLVMIEQAAAIVSVYSGDGSVSINQGGVDMGQGMVTKIEQIASYVLNIPMEIIQIHSPDTKVIPNPTSTGGSTGTAYNGEAVKQACEKMRTRMTEFGYKLLKDQGEEWCKMQGIDFWNYGKEGWAAKIQRGQDEHPKLIWQNLVALAYQYRVDLISSFTAPIPGGTTPIPAMTFKSTKENKAIPGIELADVQSTAGAVDSFVGFTFSAACSEVEVDILTGEVKILKSDIVFDMGWSLNPAIDIGQVEGAFVQGVGYVLTEKLVFEPEGEEKGRLNTLNTWTYKPPAITTIPLEMNTHLYPRNLSSEVPENPNGLFSSKEVGEPPLVLATSVFFAIKSAIRASRLERGLSGYFKLDAPATVQEVSRVLEVSEKDYSS
ncbi:molybdopterin cofactor-binding domain-containing protein [Algoriphagus machipongonensis]|uniref:Xanthine dehydrogenase/oxidase n=1 Tax=Algoriphagus machipongonensis TaxID=388413 RepID=A3HSZ6_9BACT|nr:molybdopterin cofactor-binding domain-containing protein [Algoriphagus machipongonensis]EAZ82964.1 putative xanthine dehydrogenase/oxidase [Algoriphagus machipongonensis]